MAFYQGNHKSPARQRWAVSYHCAMSKLQKTKLNRSEPEGNLVINYSGRSKNLLSQLLSKSLSLSQKSDSSWKGPEKFGHEV